MDHVQDTTYKLIPKLFNCHNGILHNDVLRTTKSKKRLKKINTICRCEKKAQSLPIELTSQLIKQPTEPHWNIKNTSFIKNLEIFPKVNTSAAVYKETFSEIKRKCEYNGWTFLTLMDQKQKTVFLMQ